MKKSIAILTFLSINFSMTAINNLHFYRSQQFFGEPRLEKPWLSTTDITISAGSTSHSRNKKGKKTEILNTCGQLAYKGHFHIIETTISYIQNFDRGFFAGIFLPVRSVQIKKVRRIECPTGKETSQAPFKKNGAGDLTLYGGWTLNYQDTSVLDYIDATFKIGALIPTAPKKDPRNCISIPLGYNGHPAITFVASSSLGVYDWLTVGTNLETILFFSKNQLICAPTLENPCAFLCNTANVHKGAIWQIGTYARADHLIQGLSGLIGYSYTQQRKESASICHANQANQLIILHGDSLCNGWSMHTINTGIDYDFSKEYMKYGFRLGAFYDIQIAGKRIFTTNMGGGMFGFDAVVRY